MNNRQWNRVAARIRTQLYDILAKCNNASSLSQKLHIGELYRRSPQQLQSISGRNYTRHIVRIKTLLSAACNPNDGHANNFRYDEQQQQKVPNQTDNMTMWFNSGPHRPCLEYSHNNCFPVVCQEKEALSTQQS